MGLGGGMNFSNGSEGTEVLLKQVGISKTLNLVITLVVIEVLPLSQTIALPVSRFNR
jgi:hypothetical protein